MRYNLRFIISWRMKEWLIPNPKKDGLAMANVIALTEFESW